MVRVRLGRQVLTIDPETGGETAGELAAACGLDRLQIDGRPVDAGCPLVVSGLVEGSLLSDEPRADTGEAVLHPWEAVVLTGPDSGARIALPIGTHVIGRSPLAAIAVADAHLEPHHALVSLPGEGTPRVDQLTGRQPLGVRDDSGRCRVLAGRTQIELRRRTDEDRHDAPPGSMPGTAASPWHLDHHRPIRPPRPEPQAAIEVPASVALRAPVAVPAALLPALLGAAAAVAIAVAMRQPLILLFGLSAVLVAAGTWAAQHIAAMRQRRAARVAELARLAAFADAVGAQADADASWQRRVEPGVGAALERIDAREPRLWERRPAHGDAWQVVLGRGELPWSPRLSTPIDPADAELAAVASSRGALDDVPVCAQLASGHVVGIAGPSAAAVTRSALLQLAANAGPADWELIVVADEPRRWGWTTWLPHPVTLVAAAEASADTLGGGREQHLVVVVDAVAALAARTSPLRRLIAADPRPAVVVIAPDAAGLPGFCTSVLVDHEHSAARWFDDPGNAGLPIPVQLAGVTTERATSAAAALAHRRDPEADGGGATPRHVDVLTLLGAAASDAIAIATGWDRAGPDPSPMAMIGEAADGRIEVDLCRDGPHTLIGGTTGAGKSELLRSLLVGLAISSPPELLAFVLVDYKGGAAFDACASLPHVAGMVTDLDDRLAARALRSLDAELRRREQIFRDVGAADLAAHRSLTGGRHPLARLVVVVDEFATLAADLPGFLSSLVAIAQRGRSLGVHLILATQRPGAAINDDIRGNTNLRIALRVQDAAEALDVVGDRAPAGFGRATPGRAMLRLGSDERVVFQVATTCGATPPERSRGLRVAYDGHTPPDADPADVPTQLETLVARIRDAAADHTPARAVWQPVLPAVATADDLVAVAPVPADACVGIVDDPVAQCRRALRWDHRRGHLLVAGSLGSGTTSAAITVALALTARHPPGELHVYVLDGRGDERLDAIRELPHCAGVVAASDRERIERLIRVLHRRTRSRSAGDADVVVIVDGVAAVRAAIDGIGGDLHERFEEILADGPGVGVCAVATTDQAVLPLALTARSPQRWIMRLADDATSAMLGLPAAEAVGSDAPPGRAVVLPERLEAQLVAPSVAAAWTPRVGGIAPPIGLLPRELDAADLPAGTAVGPRTVLPLGLDATFLQTRSLEVAQGDHVLVLGASRSGRSTALVRLARAWSDAHGDAPVVVVAPRRSPLTDAAADRGWNVRSEPPAAADATRPTLLVVDDAELTDHPEFAGWCALPGATVVAAARTDALRGAYAHWTQAVRRSRTGLVLGRPTELDGDQLGVVLPRRWPVPHAPGRGWLIVEGTCVGIVQLAADRR